MPKKRIKYLILHKFIYFSRNLTTNFNLMSLNLPKYVHIEHSFITAFLYKNISKLFFFLLFLFLVSNSLLAQGGTCADIAPFCAGNDALIFANCNISDPDCLADAEIGPDYGCLISQPYPAWFYLQIDIPGSLDFEIVQNTSFDVNGNPTGTPLDVDFIAWGPFAIGDDLCDYTQLQAFNEIGCSFSPAPIENFSIPNALTGEIYVLVITNYNQSAGFIKLGQIGGAGSTNCDIVYNCGVDIDGGDQTYCGVTNVTLTTTITGPVESYEWYKDNVLIVGQNSPTLNVSETATYKVIVDGTTCDAPVDSEATITLLGLPCSTAICTSIDFEENFGEGTGRICIDPSVATTTYLCNEFTQIEDGEYSITNISTGLNTGWHVGMEDHTLGDVDGRMLFVNAAFDPGEFYRRTISLTADSDFSFNAWITTVYDTDTGICTGTGIPANVIFRIEDTNGVLISETNTGDIQNEAGPNWQQFSIAFNTGVNVDIQLVLINNSIGGCGNDLAIDDITLTKEGSPPTLVTPTDLEACDQTGNSEATFNLESQNPIILDGQDPLDFNITFHTSQGDAELNLNAIITPTAYQNTSNPETIFVRVEKAIETTCFSIVDFDLIISNDIVLTTGLEDTIALCSTDVFPSLDATPTNSGIDLTLVTYLWTDSTGNTVSTDAVYTPVTAGIYTVVVTYPPLCGEETFTITVIVHDPAGLDLGPDQSICEGDAFEIIPILTGDLTDITYLWSPGGETTPTINVTASGTYSLEITTNSLCVSTDSIDVLFSENPLITLGDDFETCYIDDVILDGSPSNYDPTLATYVWSLNGTILSSETNPTITVNQYGYGTFSVVVTVGNCSGQDSITITPTNNITFDLGVAFETCFDQDVVLDATPSNYDSNLATYIWSLDGTILSSETNATVTVNQYGYGIFSVVVTVGGCSNEGSISLSPRNDLEVVLGDDFNTCPNEIQTIVSSTNETEVTYQWFLNGDLIVGETAAAIDVEISSDVIGTQTFTVVMTKGQCSGEDSIDLILYDIDNCVISQGLTPNNDGYNDSLDLTFLHDRTGISSLQLFNRYGTLVYEKDNYINEWTGLSKDGNELPTGTYFYVIHLLGNDPIYGEQGTGWIYINREKN